MYRMKEVKTRSGIVVRMQPDIEDGEILHRIHDAVAKDNIVLDMENGRAIIQGKDFNLVCGLTPGNYLDGCWYKEIQTPTGLLVRISADEILPLMEEVEKAALEGKIIFKGEVLGAAFIITEEGTLQCPLLEKDGSLSGDWESIDVIEQDNEYLGELLENNLLNEADTTYAKTVLSRVSNEEPGFAPGD